MADYITPIEYARSKNVSKQYIYKMLQDKRWRKQQGVKTIAGKHFFKLTSKIKTETDGN